MKSFLNNTHNLWNSLLFMQIFIIISYVLFIHLRILNTAFFFIPGLIFMVFTVEGIYLLYQKSEKPDEARSFGSGWFLWIALLFINFGIVFFFFTEFWFAGIFAMVPFTIGYLIYLKIKRKDLFGAAP
ncbi:hypothetical protein CYPRO_2569 [Cyclonatronum proteinivorum]|uniref:Uncharacterized protein n=1 Tax=Cyclonatronum proteinivorum TaxID=1457365 RepID=A0A345UMV9_9BACT|nr:hypothetical protein [Cyclonatronum proteinivorum]AXJ01811.1 hypothetical protein CYPRO_2569 [Cyclonatronum proteinivorum]